MNDSELFSETWVIFIYILIVNRRNPDNKTETWDIVPLYVKIF